jgi:hypothetical protein
MQKTELLDHAPSGQSLYAHLEPIVDLLVANGNPLAHSFRWGSNRDGYYCHVAKPIDFAALAEHFNLPATIVLVVADNEIYCEKSGCSIQTAGCFKYPEIA